MPKRDIPIEWELDTNTRYKKQNMERAVRGQIQRGLVELITNCDDSYRSLEDDGQQTKGKIRVEIERKRKGLSSNVIVRDRASGMTMEEMYDKLGTLGRRTSGFEVEKQRRGLHGRGARDLACFGTVHFESIKNNEYSHLIIPPSLKCHFVKSPPEKITSDIRNRLSIQKGNGTVVTVEVDGRFRIPKHETLVKDFSRYYSLRDLFSTKKREAILVNLNTKKEDRLAYASPSGEVVVDEDITIDGYPDAQAHIHIQKFSSPFQQDVLPQREGILIKSAATIHDCTYFGLDADPLAWRFSGELNCNFIDILVRQYDDCEEANPDNPNHPMDNPQRLLDPLRDGLINEHPFTKMLYEKCKKIMRHLIDMLREAEAPSRRNVSDESLDKKLGSLSKEISRIFDRKLREIEGDESIQGSEPSGIHQDLANGLYIIPPDEEPITVNERKTFSVRVKSDEPLAETLPVTVESSNPNIRVLESPVYLRRFSDDNLFGTTTFAVESNEVGAEAIIETKYDGYENILIIRVVEPTPPPELPEGLSFDKSLYHLGVNKEKIVILWLKSFVLEEPVPVEITSDNPQIAVKGGGRCVLRKTDMGGILSGKCKIIGRQVKVRGKVTARIEGFGSTNTQVVVEEREPRSIAKPDFKPVEDNFGSLRYKWDDRNPYLLLIGAKHPSIRRYLGELIGNKYQGVNSLTYHTVLAEVIAEALAFYVLEKQFRRQGQGGMLDYTSVDAYYHRHFSDFLNVAHKNLGAEPLSID